MDFVDYFKTHGPIYCVKLNEDIRDALTDLRQSPHDSVRLAFQDLAVKALLHINARIVFFCFPVTGFVRWAEQHAMKMVYP